MTNAVRTATISNAKSCAPTCPEPHISASTLQIWAETGIPAALIQEVLVDEVLSHAHQAPDAGLSAAGRANS